MATEKRLIDVNHAINLLREIRNNYPADSVRHKMLNMVISILANPQQTPTVDAVEVVHGWWISRIDNETPMHECSVCGSRVVKGFYEYENPNLYCYHCGAKMDGGKDNDR